MKNKTILNNEISALLNTRTVNVHLTRISSNAKTGKIPVTTSSKNTCPNSCPLKNNGCYAENYHLNLHWEKVSNFERGYSLDDLCADIAKFPVNQLWRDNQAGDQLPDTKNADNLCADSIHKKVKSNRKKRGYTYTHYELNSHNIKLINYANSNGFTINASANNISHLDELKTIAPTMPMAVLLPINHTEKVSYTPNGEKIVLCPALYNDNITCEKCAMCAIPERTYTIGFTAHGSGKNKAVTACELS